jgi:hypothetical protein
MTGDAIRYDNALLTFQLISADPGAKTRSIADSSIPGSMTFGPVTGETVPLVASSGREVYTPVCFLLYFGSLLPGFASWEPRVPRFLFHVCKADLSLAAVAEELPEESMALPTAHEVARELLADVEGEWGLARIEVTDERGTVVGVIQLSDFRLQ